MGDKGRTEGTVAVVEAPLLLLLLLLPALVLSAGGAAALVRLKYEDAVDNAAAPLFPGEALRSLACQSGDEDEPAALAADDLGEPMLLLDDDILDDDEYMK